MMRRNDRGMNSKRKRPIRPSYKFESAMRGRNRRTSMYSRLRESLDDENIKFYADNRLIYSGDINSYDVERAMTKLVDRKPEYIDLFADYLIDYIGYDIDSYDAEDIINTFSEYMLCEYNEFGDEFYIEHSKNGLRIEIFAD